MGTMQNQCGIKSSVGHIWMNTGSWTGVSVSLGNDIYKELASLGTSFTLSTSSTSDFSMATDGRLKYIGADDKTMTVNGYVATSDGARHSLAIFKNGSLISADASYSNPAKISFITAPVSMVTNDYISLYMKRLNSNSIGVKQVTLEAFSRL